MLAVLMYHRVSYTRFSADINVFARHLEYLASNYPIVVPGEPLQPRTLQVCLTFDDAYFDFYHYVFPLLKELNIKAVLAIPAGLILDRTKLSAQSRLQVPYQYALKAFKTHATLCTWQEIREMVISNCVVPAAHGFMHENLNHSEELTREIIHSKRLLKEKTHRTIDTFVYPYGQISQEIHMRVAQQYKYVMRIGSAYNYDWSNLNQLIYRIDADDFWPKSKPLFSLPHKLKLGLRLASNTVRFR